MVTRCGRGNLSHYSLQRLKIALGLCSREVVRAVSPDPSRIAVVVLILLFVLLPVIRSFSQSSTDYEIHRRSVSSGGVIRSTASSYEMDDIAGQSSPVGQGLSADYEIMHGYLVPTDIFPNVVFRTGMTNDNHGRGLAWVDLDNDDDWDLYVSRGTQADHQDYVFINNGDGTFTESSSIWTDSETRSGLGVAFADYDGDGDRDGFVQNDDNTSHLWRNDFDNIPAFQDVASTEGIPSLSALMPSWGDYDGDGLVDVVLVSDSGSPPSLFENSGNYAISGAQGFLGNTSAIPDATMGVGSWADLNGDGYLDLFVAQEIGPDLLFLNDQTGGFTNTSGSFSGVARTSQGVTFGDYNNDGLLDVFVTSGGSGNDVLWRNDGAGSFTDISSVAGITDSADGRGCVFFDVDNDGDVDLYVANASDQRDILYVNQSDGTFTQLLTGQFTSSYGCAVADYDLDGDLDIAVTGDTNYLTLYENQSTNRNFIRVRASDSSANQTTFGAHVILRDAADHSFVAMVHIDGGSGRGTQSQYDAHFGVPNATKEYNVEVRFARTVDGEQVVVDRTSNPGLGGISAGEIDGGYIGVRENGRIEFSHGVAYTRSLGNQDIYSIALLGGTATQITTNSANDYSPSWAPDGQKLVFVSDRNTGAGSNSELYTIRADGANETRLFTPEWSASEETEPAWSSDGSQIAFVTDRDENKEIYITNTAGNEIRNLTDNAALDSQPAWNAQSTKIAFVSDRDGSDSDILVMNFDGSNPAPVSDVDATGNPLDNSMNDIEPNWSPDGLSIVFASDRDSSAYQIFAMQFDGTLQTQLTSGGGDKRHPVFNAKGDKVIYETGGELRVMDFPGGGNDFAITDAGFGNSQPAYPVLFRNPPKSVVFGVKDGQTLYWADPVNTQLGNFTQVATDFVLPGFGDPIVWSRTYNSQDPMMGPLACGWRFSYQIKVAEEADGSIAVTWGDGTQDFFVPNVDGDYTPIEGRTTHSFVKEIDDSYTLTTREDTIFAFFAASHPSTPGKLSTISDKNDNAITLVYDGTSGLLTDVTQASSRNLKVIWDNQPPQAGDNIVEVREDIPGLSDPRSVIYEYNANGDLEKVIKKDGVMYTRFEYDAAHRITAVYELFDGSDEHLRVSNTYDDDGRVIEQVDGNGNLSGLEYGADELNRQATTLTDARSNTQEHIYDEYRRLVQFQDESGNLVQHHYDANSYKSHIVDRDGNTFETPFNTSGQPVRFEDPLGNVSRVSYSEGFPETRTVCPDPLLSAADRTTQYAYDAKANLELVTDALGNAAALRYDANGKPVEIDDELGNTTQLFYDSVTGDLEQIVNALGHVTTLEHDVRGRMTALVDPEGNRTEYTYLKSDLLETVIDPRGNPTTFTYFDDGMLKSITNALGHASSFTYDENNNVKTATDPRGHVTSYAYDENNNLTNVNDTYQGTPRQRSYVYDEQNRLVAVTDPEDNIVQYTYDAHDRVTTFTDARGQQFHTEFDASGRQTRTHTTLTGNTLETLYAYNGVGELVAETIIDPLGPKPAGITTQYEYDKLGRVTQVIDDDGNETITEYYNTSGPGAYYGALKREVDINGRETTYEYDSLGRVVNVFDNIGRRTHYEYDEAGRVISIDTGPTSPSDPFVTEYEYDENGNRTKVINPHGDVLETEYDALNRPVRVYLPHPNGGPRGAFTEYIYDENGEIGRLTHVVDPSGNATQYSYDEDGNILTVLDAGGNVLANTYDKIGRLVEEIAAFGTADASGVQYAYDANGNRVQVTKLMETSADDQIQTWGYDALNRVIRHTDALGRETLMEYDLVGNLVRHETADNLITQTAYDNLYRISVVTYPDGSTATYAYDDANGHPTNILSIANDDLGTTAWTYDDMDRVSTVTDVFGKVVGYAYDHFDRVSTLTYPGNLDVTYTYNDRHQITSVTDWLGNSATYEYDEEQRLKRQLNSNDTETLYTYQPNGWLDTLVNQTTNGSLISSYSLTTDDVGNRTKIQRDEPLLPFPTPDSAVSTFDKANQIKTDGTVQYEFDDRGNLIREHIGGIDQKSYSYDYANRLVQVTDQTGAGPVVTTYDYDDSGTRMISTHDGEQSRYTLDRRGMGWVISENDASNSEEFYYVYGNGLAWRVNVDTDATDFYHGDHIGSVTSITDHDGNPLQGYAYNEFGATQGTFDSPLVQSFQFVGLHGVQQDNDGLHFMRARYYLAQIGIFSSLDPIFSVQPYAYAANSPALNTDPSGKISPQVLTRALGVVPWATVGAGYGDMLANSLAGFRFLGAYGESIARTGSLNIFDDDELMADIQEIRAQQLRRSAEWTQFGFDVGKSIDEISLLISLQIDPSVNLIGNSVISGSANQFLGRPFLNDRLSEYRDSLNDISHSSSLDVTQEVLSYNRMFDHDYRYRGANEVPLEARKGAARRRARRIENFLRPYQERQAQVQGQINSLTGGRGWDALSGRHELTYSTATNSELGINSRFLSGFWYTNESRIANMFIPGKRESAAQKALSAHAALVNSVRTSILSNYGKGTGANGRNTPFIPEVWQIDMAEGQMQPFVK